MTFEEWYTEEGFHYQRLEVVLMKQAWDAALLTQPEALYIKDGWVAVPQRLLYGVLELERVAGPRSAYVGAGNHQTICWHGTDEGSIMQQGLEEMRRPQRLQPSEDK